MVWTGEGLEGSESGVDLSLNEERAWLRGVLMGETARVCSQRQRQHAHRPAKDSAPYAYPVRFVRTLSR